MNALRVAIYNKSQETSNLKIKIGTRFYFDRAPEKVTYPYIVCHEIVDDYFFTFQEYFETVRIQMNVYSDDTSAVEVETLCGYLKDVFDWTSLTVTGYRHLKNQRMFSRVFWDDAIQKYIGVVDYGIYLEKT